MKDNNKTVRLNLDSDEREILESVELGEWRTTDQFDEEYAFARKASSNYLNKDARVNIRISSPDLARLKQKAAYKGLPYQTLIASVLHEYAAGHFEGKL